MGHFDPSACYTAGCIFVCILRYMYTQFVWIYLHRSLCHVTLYAIMVLMLLVLVFLSCQAYFVTCSSHLISLSFKYIQINDSNSHICFDNMWLMLIDREKIVWSPIEKCCAIQRIS